MSGFNPFRRQDGHTAVATVPTPGLMGNPPSSDPSSKLAHPIPSAVSSGYPGKSALSLEIEEDDSTSSDDRTADPFNPDSSVSDNDDDNDNSAPKDAQSPAPRDDRPRQSSGSTPHAAPSADGSTATSSTAPFTSDQSNPQPATNTPLSNIAQDITPSTTRARPTSEYMPNTRSPSRGNKERKPPPPPRNHHGKRISVPASSTSSSSAAPTNRLSLHGTSPESTASARMTGTPNASSTNPQSEDYFSVSSEQQAATDSIDSVQRSYSQHKRPPTPPLSRRHSQMRRSKSTQSKSSGSRLTMSSYDSEGNDSSRPPSPGPSNRSIASTSQERKRISMPPSSSSGDIRAAALSTGTPSDTAPTTNPRALQAGRRASSHGSILSGSSSGAPPPPPPRRARDPSTRSSEVGTPSQTNSTGGAPVPQPSPSNAQDILADLSRLQKEVDDLRGHYETRKVSQ